MLRKIVITAAILFACAMPSQADALTASMLRDVGAGRPGGCPSRWCACYLERKLRQAGHDVLGSYRARDFAAYGRRTTPHVGAIMVMRNHVGVVVGSCGNGKVKLVSGNHSRRVGVGCYSQRRAIAWRTP